MRTPAGAGRGAGPCRSVSRRRTTVALAVERSADRCVVSIGTALIASERHSGPHELDDPERPGSPPGIRRRWRVRTPPEPEGEDLAATFERVHQHHEAEGENPVDGQQHEADPISPNLMRWFGRSPARLESSP